MSPQVLQQVQAVRARVAQRIAAAETPAGATWRGMPLETRTVLVMLAGSQPGDPRTIAGQAWEQFTAADQCAIGALARQLAADLAGAGRLR